MILAYHVIFGAYGFWLPNDPRGSWSQFIRSYELYRSGPATKVNTRRSVAGSHHDRTARQRAKAALQYPPVMFTGHQALSIGRGFAWRTERSGFAIHACSVLPDHVHLVVGRHRLAIEQMENLLKGSASYQLRVDGRHPLSNRAQPDGSLPSPWAQGLWKVFLDSEQRVREAIEYVQQNPVKAGYAPQNWSFVTPFGNKTRPFRAVAKRRQRTVH
ncbi:MAG: hypothetical protein V3U29_07110 [Phycisphaeraceae bacterium]